MALQVTRVDEGSLAAQLGIVPGNTLISINGMELCDMLDYQYYTAVCEFHLVYLADGETKQLDVEKEQYEPFGCNFKTYLGDEKHSCDNHCMFCFIDQLPKGLRDNLYFKDDDERLSFLFGNYITMTNLTEHEVDRIIQMHISPIYVSVHTTNPDLRIRMMANKKAGETLAYLDRFVEAGIALNCQLVLCKGINDGDELRRTLDDLLAKGDGIQSIAAVPAGVTDYRQGLFHLEPYDGQTSAQTLDILEEYGEKNLAKTGHRVVYPSDEWYLNSGRELPPYEFYGDFHQLEDGVGMWRLFHDEFLDELEASHGILFPHKMDVVTGTMAAPLIEDMAARLNRRHPQIKICVHAIKNEFFGGNVSVAGLITGTDIIKQCTGQMKSHVLGVPEVMLRDEKDMFLDNITTGQLAKQLGCKVVVLPTDGAGCCRALLGTRSKKQRGE